MPVLYAHVEFDTNPRAVLQRIVRNAEHLLKGSQVCLSDCIQQEYRALQGEVETYNQLGFRVCNLIEMKDDFNELSRWIDKVKVVELKTPADEWEEFAVSQRPLYTKEAIQKLPDDMIRYIAEYLEDDLSITCYIGDAFRTHALKTDIRSQFRGDVLLGTADWSGNALKFLWLKHVVPKINLQGMHINQRDLRKALIKSLLNWDKFRLRENINCLISPSGDFTFGYRWGGKIEMIKIHNQHNVFSNKAIHHLIKTINWMNKTMTKEKLKRFRCPHLKKVDELVETIGNDYTTIEKWRGDYIKPVIAVS
jgi:hypothetical protein